MSDEELQALYDQDLNALGVHGGINFIIDELERRESRRRTTMLVRLTWAIFVLTFVLVVLTLVIVGDVLVRVLED